MAIFKCMMKVAFIRETHYMPPQQVVAQDPANEKINIKKPVPNKFKTDLCRNWMNTSFCKFGKDCTYAHGDHDLQK